MAWAEHIHADPSILGGKPVIRGTRLSVDFVLALLGQGWSREALLENYPQRSHEALLAVFAYAADVLHDRSLLPVPPGAT